MGTEVLDDGSGEPPPGSVPVHRDVTVVAFDELAPAPAPRTAAPVRRGLQRLGLPRRALVAALACLVAGAALGVVVGRRSERAHVQGQQAAADARAVAVLAFASDSAGYRGVAGPTVLLTVEVTNAGPRPVTVLGSPFGVNAARGRPVVRPVGLDAPVVPGQRAQVYLVVAVDCAAGRGDDLTLTVRTGDQRVHPVAIQASAAQVQSAAPCQVGGPTAPARPR